MTKHGSPQLQPVRFKTGVSETISSLTTSLKILHNMMKHLLRMNEVWVISCPVLGRSRWPSFQLLLNHVRCKPQRRAEEIK